MQFGTTQQLDLPFSFYEYLSRQNPQHHRIRVYVSASDRILPQDIPLLHLNDRTVIEMEVTAADGAPGDFDDDISGINNRRFKSLDNFHIVLSVPSESFHLFTAGISPSGILAGIRSFRGRRCIGGIAHHLSHHVCCRVCHNALRDQSMVQLDVETKKRCVQTSRTVQIGNSFSGFS
jgi:hypothetical protein